ncbi:MAG: SPFH domain-containing protein [Coriobacteriales bacterium]|nr:SPFH domain-containing protein [Coriobacteriales bacterium]
MDKTTQALIADTHTEFAARARKGLALFILLVLAEFLALGLFVLGIVAVTGKVGELSGLAPFAALMIVAGALLFFVIVPLLFAGFKIIKPNEARVLTLFGHYLGSLRHDGIFWVNPFAGAVKVATPVTTGGGSEATQGKSDEMANLLMDTTKISLKTMTLSTEKQKINDLLGNPIIISIIVIWRVVDTAKAVFNVDNYFEFLSVQSDSALRNIVRKYPYDSTDDVSGHEKSLRGSSQEIADNLRAEIQEKVRVAGLEIVEARITHLAYAPEIAAAMLQRQQASAVVDARQLIVEGAVGMVQMALEKLNEREIVELDEERKASMVSNLMVVLCANKDAQPIVNSGTLY